MNAAVAGSKAWIVAGSVGVVEALKDQGFARWDYTFRSIHHYAKSNLRSVSHAKNQIPNSPPPTTVAMAMAMVSKNKVAEEKARQQSEESLRKVMYLSCWGPN